MIAPMIRTYSAFIYLDLMIWKKWHDGDDDDGMVSSIYWLLTEFIDK